MHSNSSRPCPRDCRHASVKAAQATSHLDPEAQAAVIETVRHLKGRLTILAVAHQDLLIQAADRIYRLADGQISELHRQNNEARLPVRG